MKMKKRAVAVLLAAVTAAGLLAGCGGKGSENGSGSTEEGKVINIYSWNDSFVHVLRQCILRLKVHLMTEL